MFSPVYAAFMGSVTGRQYHGIYHAEVELMKRLAVFLLLCALPAALFAQGRQSSEKQTLQQLGLNDGQITQVIDIQGKVRATLRADAVQLRLLRAQMDKALLAAPASVDMQAVNGFISQMSLARTDIQKTLVGAQLQLRQIMGDDGFRVFMHRVRGELRHGFMDRRPGPGMMSDRDDMMSDQGGMMSGETQFD
jgi:hypothetical protein